MRIKNKPGGKFTGVVIYLREDEETVHRNFIAADGKSFTAVISKAIKFPSSNEAIKFLNREYHPLRKFEIAEWVIGDEFRSYPASNVLAWSDGWTNMPHGAFDWSGRPLIGGERVPAFAEDAKIETLDSLHWHIKSEI